MKKMAHEAIEHFSKIVGVTGDSRTSTDDEVRIVAMACYIQELEESNDSLAAKLEDVMGRGLCANSVVTESRLGTSNSEQS